jgi:hypothetical protein
VSARQFAGSWLVGLGVGLTTLALVRGDFDGLAFPFLFGVVGLMLLARSGQTALRFPGTDLERGLDRLFALLFPMSKATKTATARFALAREIQLAGLRQGARRWGKELQLIKAAGYETASRLSALCELTSEAHDRALAAEAVSVLRAERARAGIDLTRVGDPVSMLAYGLGARPAAADLTSLDELLLDLGLAQAGDELRTHFDDLVDAEGERAKPHLRNDAQRSMFRDLAGASFVLGASTRILELASFIRAGDTMAPASAASPA